MTDLEAQARLVDFYIAYAAWLDAGAPETSQPGAFSRSHGLCSNVRRYCDRKNTPHGKVYDALVEQFAQAGLSAFLPFDSYHWESVNGTAHLNPARVAWVRAHLPDPETAV